MIQSRCSFLFLDQAQQPVVVLQFYCDIYSPRQPPSSEGSRRGSSAKECQGVDKGTSHIPQPSQSKPSLLHDILWDDPIAIARTHIGNQIAHVMGREVKFRRSTPDDYFAEVGVAHGKALYNSTVIQFADKPLSTNTRHSHCSLYRKEIQICLQLLGGC